MMVAYIVIPVVVLLTLLLSIFLYCCCNRRRTKPHTFPSGSTIRSSFRRASYYFLTNLANPQDLRVSDLMRNLTAVNYRNRETICHIESSNKIEDQIASDPMIKFLLGPPLPQVPNRPPPPPPAPQHLKRLRKGSTHRSRRSNGASYYHSVKRRASFFPAPSSQKHTESQNSDKSIVPQKTRYKRKKRNSKQIYAINLDRYKDSHGEDRNSTQRTSTSFTRGREKIRGKSSVTKKLHEFKQRSSMVTKSFPHLDPVSRVFNEEGVLSCSAESQVENVLDCKSSHTLFTAHLYESPSVWQRPNNVVNPRPGNNTWEPTHLMPTDSLPAPPFESPELVASILSKTPFIPLPAPIVTLQEPNDKKNTTNSRPHYPLARTDHSLGLHSTFKGQMSTLQLPRTKRGAFPEDRVDDMDNLCYLRHRSRSSGSEQGGRPSTPPTPKLHPRSMFSSPHPSSASSHTRLTGISTHSRC
ncbi:uncharacterized protein LOC121866478 isoform X1 [Homarus americanus]|uniref:Uncharacterized protein n=1 Tax=Homarus americanus TaxID=6706 RepID=A0A8J5MYC0_HOMAM|nr:uncharacterized protein LOC121866478 isoform X1 [Homarus americanus]KAG7169010.1 hypothetical protein Hamer_G011705 [Homarus americanus]